MRTVRRTFHSGRTATVLSLDTEDLTRPPHVQAAFDEILSVLGERAVVVDLRGVARLTSMGLSALSAGADVARRKNAGFAIAGARPEVRHLLQTLDLAGGAERGEGQHIQITEDVESALRTLDDGPGDA